MPALLPRRDPRVQLVAVGEEASVLAGPGDRRHHLNATALALWHVCDGQTTVEEMVAAVEELYGLPRPVVRRHVEAALTEMAEAGLVQL